MLTDAPQIQPLLKAGEVAEILKISRTQAYRLLASGELPCLRFGGKTVRIRRADLERFITGQPKVQGIGFENQQFHKEYQGR